MTDPTSPIEHKAEDDHLYGAGWAAYLVKTPVNNRQFAYLLNAYLELSSSHPQTLIWGGDLNQASEDSPVEMFWQFPTDGPRSYGADDLVDFAATYTYDESWKPDPSEDFDAVKTKAAAGEDLSPAELQIAVRGLLTAGTP